MKCKCMICDSKNTCQSSAAVTSQDWERKKFIGMDRPLYHDFLFDEGLTRAALAKGMTIDKMRGILNFIVWLFYELVENGCSVLFDLILLK